jgi:uncharacterized protein YjdB
MRNVNIFKKAAAILLLMAIVTTQIFSFPVAAESTVTMASGKLPTSSEVFTNLSRVTDGDLDTNNYSDGFPNQGLQWIQLDLGAACNLNEIKLWHYFGDSRKYHDVIVQISNTSDFSTDVTTLYNNDTNNSAGLGIGTDSEYTETSAGLDINFVTTSAKYVRFYSNGNTVNTYNHYVESEVYASDITAHISSISLDKNTDTIPVGGTDTLTASFIPADAANRNVTWTSDNTSVATVSSNGVVNGVADGSANIKVTTADGGYADTCAITVIASPASGNLVAGKIPTVSSAFKDISFATDGDKNTANFADSYSNTGLQWVQIDLGASYSVNDIKLWHYFGDARKYHDVVVQLSNDPAFSTGVTTIFNNDTDNSAGRGTGTESEYAETSSGKDMTFNTVNARYARFYSNGSSANKWDHYVEIQIYNLTTGSTTAGNLAAGKISTASSAFKNISFTTDSDKNTANFADSYSNTGLQWVQIDLGASYSVNDIKLWHYFGDARKYHDVVVQLSNDPAFATGVTTVFNNDTDNSAGRGAGTDSEYSETSSGNDIAVNNVNARYARFYSNGSTANKWNHYVEIEIYGSNSVPVVNPTSVSLNKTADTLTVGGTDTLTATVLPADASNKNVTWTSSAPSVATVSSIGLVTAVSAGTATITAKTEAGGYTASCSVTVNNPVVHPTSVSLNKTTDILTVGGTDALTATVMPAGASNKNVTWTSSATGVASVSSTGLVTAVSAGTATITAKTADGSYTASCAVTVKNASIKGIDVSKWQGTINWALVKGDGIQFAMIRSSYGDGTSNYLNNGVDPMFETNYAAAKANGVEVGAYHYSHATTVEEATTEANFFISRLKGKQFGYPVCVDLEDATQSTLDKETLTDIAITYLSILRQAGYYPMIYCNKSWFTTELDDIRLVSYDHWLAQWAPSITYTGTVGIWQYSSTGSVDGITGNVDLDTSFCDYASKIKSLHLNGF